VHAWLIYMYHMYMYMYMYNCSSQSHGTSDSTTYLSDSTDDNASMIATFTYKSKLYSTQDSFRLSGQNKSDCLTLCMHFPLLPWLQDAPIVWVSYNIQQSAIGTEVCGHIICIPYRHRITHAHTCKCDSYPGLVCTVF
jgi:hypothetical protein